MVQEYTNYVLLMEGISHLRENYTDHVFTVHEYIYRVVPFAFNSHKRDFGVENINNSHKRETTEMVLLMEDSSHLRDFFHQEQKQ